MSNLADYAKNELKRIEKKYKEPQAEAVNNAHWIDGHNGTISCSRCSTWFYKDSRYPYMRYCPYCNVKIVESEEQV